jgi:two-component system, cell cycle sensor histidine kinase and response regulator CckA
MADDREALRSGLLARMTSLFSATLDLERTMRGVTEAFVPKFGEWCSVDILDRGVATRLAYEITAAPGLADVLSQSRALSPIGDPASLLAPLLGERRTRVFQVQVPADLPWSGDERHRELIETLLPCSIVVAPLRAHRDAFGVLTLISVRGSHRYSEDDVAFIEDVAHRAAFAIGTPDVHRELQAELLYRPSVGEAMAALHRHDQELFEAIPIPLWTYDVETLRFLAVNDAAIAQYGFSREEFLARTIYDIRPVSERTRLEETLTESREGLHHGGIFTHQRKDGSTLLAEVTSHEMTFEGRKARIVCAKDVTKRVQAFESMRVAEERYRLVSIATKEAVWDWDPVSGRMEWNPSFAALFRFKPEEIVATRAWCDSRIHPDERQSVVRELEQAMARHEDICVRTYRFRRGDGTYVYIADRAVVSYDEGTPVRVVGSLADVTREHELAEQLGVAQRMEAVGRLAGGIAHDFNNLLTAIRGFATFALDAQPPNDPARDDIDQVLQAADRAAALTKQLLAFSRRQVLQPQLVIVNDLLKSLERMFARVLGEDIELRTSLDPNLWPILVDPGQFEQVIMNLVVNARDAMPNGGTLAIESSNAVLDEAYAQAHVGTSAGEYVMVSVTDSGMGMDAQTQARIFEPFFTTKEHDRGTGLGLATSYGIVSQSGGHIEVQSELERGTTFRIYLPRSSAESTPIGRRTTLEATGIEGNETILLVEDDERVRRVASAALRRYGYRVLEAPSAEEALRHFAAESDAVRLVVTDVVLPRMSGAQLARELRAMRPELRVLFVSGYREDSFAQEGRMDPGIALLEKPFSPDALARRVRGVLDSGR